MPEQQEGNKRTRMNFGMNAKGLIQLDITVEYPTVEETTAAARAAIDQYKQVCTEKGLTLAGGEA